VNKGSKSSRGVLEEAKGKDDSLKTSVGRPTYGSWIGRGIDTPCV
jgi:hypothetical protein